MYFSTPLETVPADDRWMYHRVTMVPRQSWFWFGVESSGFAAISFCEDVWNNTESCHEVQISRLVSGVLTTQIVYR